MASYGYAGSVVHHDHELLQGLQVFIIHYQWVLAEFAEDTGSLITNIPDFFSLSWNAETTSQPVKAWKKSIPLLFSARVHHKSYTGTHLRCYLLKCLQNTGCDDDNICVAGFDHDDFAAICKPPNIMMNLSSP